MELVQITHTQEFLSAFPILDTFLAYIVFTSVDPICFSFMAVKSLALGLLF